MASAEGTRRAGVQAGVSVELRSRPVSVRDPLHGLLAVREVVGDENAFLMESLAGPAEDTRSSLIGITGLLEVSVYRSRLAMEGIPGLVELAGAALRASGVVVTDGDGLVLRDDDALWQVPRVLDGIFDVARTTGSFSFGVLVYFGYDAVRYVERLPRTIADPLRPVPDAVFSLVHALVTVDLATGGAELIVAESEAWPSLDVDACCALIERGHGADERVRPVDVPPPTSVEDDVDEAEFAVRVGTALDHVRRGDVYQVQLGHELTIRSDARYLDVYRRLRTRNPSPYMCVIPLAGSVIVGASPELFVRVEGRQVTMRPIAGTARRQDDPAADARTTEHLLADPKERAEHIMLVDLCRNDLSRIAEPASLDIPDFMIIETYSHMFHIVSTVTARLAEPHDVYDVIKASFPAGTMTGAPKVRAMEIIESLETSRRGVYAGSFGLIGFGGWSILGLAIRMAVTAGGVYSLRASAGIVADSSPAAEWRETLTKLGATYWAVTGQELS